VLQARQDLSFGAEACDHVLGIPTAADQFHRNLLRERPVSALGQPYRAHAATTDFPQQAEGADHSPGLSARRFQRILDRDVFGETDRDQRRIPDQTGPRRRRCIGTQHRERLGADFGIVFAGRGDASFPGGTGQVDQVIEELPHAAPAFRIHPVSPIATVPILG